MKNQGYDGPQHMDDYPQAITVDTNGSIYVTGCSRVSGTVMDIVTLKYDADGIQKWVRRYSLLSESFDFPTGIVVDSAGYVYEPRSNLPGYAQLEKMVGRKSAREPVIC